jgi:hypothetical protein
MMVSVRPAFILLLVIVVLLVLYGALVVIGQLYRISGCIMNIYFFLVAIVSNIAWRID